MRLTTVWTMRGLSLRERFARTAEVAVRAAAHAVPQRFAYWVLLDQGARHMGNRDHRDEVIPEVPFMDVVQRCGDAARVR